MKRWRRWLLSLLAVLLLLAGAYPTLDFWLQSAGGRQALERVLGERIGLPVRLAGEFNVMLLPSAGASGTQLLVADADGADLARAGAFATALDLRSLLRGEMVVRHVRLERLTLGAQGGPRFLVPALRVGRFRENHPTELDIDLGFLGSVKGEFTWRPGPATIDLDLEWRAEQSEPARFEGRVAYFEDRADFSGVRVELGGQVVTGQGCFLAAGEPELNLDLEAGVIDIEALMAGLPGGEGGAGMLPLRVNLRLQADEIRQGDIRSFQTTVEAGVEPRCP